MNLLGVTERLKRLLGIGDPLEPQVWGVPLRIFVLLDVLLVLAFVAMVVIEFA